MTPLCSLILLMAAVRETRGVRLSEVRETMGAAGEIATRADVIDAAERLAAGGYGVFTRHGGTFSLLPRGDARARALGWSPAPVTRPTAPARVREALALGPTTTRALAGALGLTMSRVRQVLAEGEREGWAAREGREWALVTRRAA